mmetsp:Transcript_111188/g.321413  ORF Transcript_111188/g.321413 Transcript_111188/m.321413 type:complete len:120 (-) Transcript_111188:100-459(-)
MQAPRAEPRCNGTQLVLVAAGFGVAVAASLLYCMSFVSDALHGFFWVGIFFWVVSLSVCFAAAYCRESSPESPGVEDQPTEAGLQLPTLLMGNPIFRNAKAGVPNKTALDMDGVAATCA